jgi:hypothetical protein
MEYIIQGRRSGKTAYLIEKFLEDPEHSVIVCFNKMEASRIVRTLKDLRAPEEQREWQKLLLNNVITTDRAVHLRGRDAKVYVDNLDNWIRSFFGNVQAVTMTEE